MKPESTNFLTDLSNWKTVANIAQSNPQFKRTQIQYLFKQRNSKPGLSKCCRIIGKTMYINEVLFCAWMGGLLPEQQENP